jgi:6-phospho-3-hexuloisomerase
MGDTMPSQAAVARPDEFMRSPVTARAQEIIGEIRQVVGAVDPAAIAALLGAVGQARRVFFDAQGRSGLVARAWTMRWMHLGVTSYMTGETVTPAIGEGDLLVCLSAKGRTGATVAHAATAHAAGARIAALTTTPDSRLAAAADLLVLVPAGNGVASVQHAGSLFEQACLILSDAMCGVFQQQRVISDTELDARHANLL